ncbi:hypothetical protein D3C76_1640170 [compost metagenome]
MLRIIQKPQHDLAPRLVSEGLHVPATGQLQDPGRRRSLIQADAIGKRHERIVDALVEQFRCIAQAIDGMDGTVAVRYQPGQRHL